MEKNIALIHGWGAETKKLEPLKRELGNLGWNVFLPKLPGFESKPPKSVWGIKEYADFVYQKIKTSFKREEYIVFGHSFGGSIAINLASRSSDGLKRIVLCAPGGFSRGNYIKRIFFISLAKTGKIFLLTPDIADMFRKLLYKFAREHDYEKTSGIMREVFKKVISEDLRPGLRNIKVPTLILWGEKDKMAPVSGADLINKSIQNSTIKIFNEEGHRLPYNKPKILAREIDKWSQQ